MQLYIARGQAQEMLGNVGFILRVKVKLSHEEEKLVSTYNAYKEVLLQKEIKIPFTTKVFMLKIGIGDLIAGQNFKCKDIADILEYEKNVKEACKSFLSYLEVMKTFGGEEVIEYTWNKIPNVKHISTEMMEITEAENLEKMVEKDNDEESLEQAGLEFCYHCGADLPEKSQRCPVCEKVL